jgi:2-keto-4-pentenoate hydratase/2-oxohepta-3-ene-1,7-dioic acid hydratase in catechol pathway
MSSVSDVTVRVGHGVIAGVSGLVIEHGGRCASLTDLVSDPPQLTVLEVISAWSEWRQLIVDAAANLGGATTSIATADVVWEIPTRPAKLICIGANYFDHVAEMGTPPPAIPYSFFKPASTALVADGAEVTIPPQAQLVDWEAELALVIGARTHHATASTAMNAIGGYAVINDLSARDWIESRPPVGIDWVMQKAHDGFAPIGGLVTPAEFISDPHDLAIRCWVNEELKQESSTSLMVHRIPELITHLSAIMTLEPGDLIATGTPAGVGFAAKPRQALHAGDVVRAEVEGLGSVQTRMVSVVKQTESVSVGVA